MSGVALLFGCLAHWLIVDIWTVAVGALRQVNSLSVQRQLIEEENIVFFDVKPRLSAVASQAATVRFRHGARKDFIPVRTHCPWDGGHFIGRGSDS